MLSGRIWGSSGCVGGVSSTDKRERKRGAARGLLQDFKISVLPLAELRYLCLICLCSGE